MIEDRNLHNHSVNERNIKPPAPYAAPIITKNIKISPVATTTNKAAKMQTPTNLTTMTDKPTKSGTTIDLDGPNITHYAPTNDIYKHLGSTGDNEEEELSINATMSHNNLDTTHTKIATNDQQSVLKTPPKAPFSTPANAFEHRLDKSRSSGPNSSPDKTLLDCWYG